MFLHRVLPEKKRLSGESFSAAAVSTEYKPNWCLKALPTDQEFRNPLVGKYLE